MTCRTCPVQRERVVGPASERAHLLLADIVGPSATVDALGSTHVRQCQECPVDLVGMVEVVDPCSHNDHGPSTGLQRVQRELATDAFGCSCWHAGELGLPGGSARHRGIVVTARPLAGQTFTANGVLGKQEVVDCGD